MLELGDAASRLHRDVGRYAAAAGIDVLVGIRGHARPMVEEARAAGLPDVHYFDDPAEAGSLARRIARPGDAVLFKGSRGVAVERALERFLG
jgi:UDP-N-acetylmuramoyl-tripeptide--D-alanyl-D-alanine ligase